jgi:hypothetical protein
MIPKVIHYCWFGDNKLPTIFKKCINSWSKNCPDYEIICWNESNYDINKNCFMEEAYLARKFPFVSDYARLDIVFNHGGFYMDTDVLLRKSLDSLINNKAFFALDSGGANTGIGFGATKGHPIVSEIMESYKDEKFLKDGRPDLTPCTVRTTEILKKKGFIHADHKQLIGDVLLLPEVYFSPFFGNSSKPKISDQTIGEHLSARTWSGPLQRIKAKIRMTLGPVISYKIKNYLSLFLTKYR